MRHEFRFVSSVAVTIKARKVSTLSRISGLTITSDSRVKLDSNPTSNQVWPTAEALRPFYNETDTYRGSTPTIAIVDSGIEQNRLDFDGGARVVGDQVITRLVPNSPGDGRGHGTFVAGIAAGSAAGYAGAAPQAKIVSLDVMDDNGMARTSDVIAAAQWIYEHKNEKNIRVANFSLHSTVPSNFTSDPLDKAVEKLWFAGVTVVVAAGNYGRPDGPSGVMFAPGNDPFVITVGALDLDGSVRIPNHDVPNWSAYGYTYDGFRKPEIAAAGRYMVGPVPATATLPALKPENVVGCRLHAALRNVVRGAGRRRRSGSDPGQAPELDARSGQGRSHAGGSARPGRTSGLGRGRRGQRLPCSHAEQGSEPERGAGQIPHGGSGRRLDPGVRRGQLVGRCPVECRAGTRRAGRTPPGAMPRGRTSAGRTCPGAT